MKMTRIFASLLCLMMIVTAIPMMQAAAATAPAGAVDYTPLTILYDDFSKTQIMLL